MLLANDIVFSHWFPKNRSFKRKKTKTYGLEGLYASLRQGRSFPLPTLPFQKTNRYAVVDITNFFYTELAYIFGLIVEHRTAAMSQNATFLATTICAFTNRPFTQRAVPRLLYCVYKPLVVWLQTACSGTTSG